MTQTPAEFFAQHPVQDVECLFADLTGVGRGKGLPAKAFVAGQDLRVARAIAATSLTRDWLPELYADGDPDLRLVPVAGSLRLVPWANPPRALALHDCFDLDGKPTAFAPRNVLKRVLALYQGRGWEPVVAPEIEFYLVALNPDPTQPFVAPNGRDGRREVHVDHAGRGGSRHLPIRGPAGHRAIGSRRHIRYLDKQKDRV